MPTKPKLGQNFLNDTAAIERIADSLGDLAARAHRLIAVELDPALAAHLRAEFPAENVTIVNQDVLSFDFAAAAARAGQPLLVFGNLPYYITSPILLKLAESHASIDRVALMVQREVADRVTAQPGSREYGVLSVTVQLYGPAVNLFTLPPSAFSPPPDVHSTVFRWRFAPRFTELGIDQTTFLPFLRSVFAQKRKTIANNLRAAGHSSREAGLSSPAIASALVRANIPPNARAEQLSIESLATLFRALATPPTA
jgi:16S rRNA (adenine1518-N6/adenine1519-N6)-dimethyltransferase